jgi:hypothetical protein
LHQHSSSLQWEKKLDFRTPREKQSQDARPNKHEKLKERPKERTERSKERTSRNKERTKKPDRGASPKRLKTSRSESGSRPRIPESEQCRRPACIERGNHLNHTHAKCRFASSSTRFSNLGKAPAKKTKPVVYTVNKGNHLKSFYSIGHRTKERTCTRSGSRLPKRRQVTTVSPWDRCVVSYISSDVRSDFTKAPDINLLTRRKYPTSLCSIHSVQEKKKRELWKL